VAAKIGPIRPQSLKFSPEELERVFNRKLPLEEPMEEENHHATQREEEREGGEFNRRMDRMDLLENSEAAFGGGGGGGGGGGSWLQLAMASKMMAFPRPERNANESSIDSGGLLLFAELGIRI